MPAWIGSLNRAVDGTIAVSSSVASLPGENLQNPHGDSSNAWQSAGQTTCTIRVDAGTEAATWQMFGLFRTNLTAGANMRITIGSQAWLESGAPANWDSGLTSAGVTPGFGQAVRIAPAEVTGRYCRFSVQDPGNPDGFLAAAQIYAGPGYQAGGISYESAWQRSTTQQRTETRGGQEFVSEKFSRRGWDVSFPNVPTSQVYTQIMEAMRMAGLGRNILFVPFGAGADITRDAVFGRLEVNGGIGYRNGAGMRRTWRATITERL